MSQSREKVRAFFTRYQGRILYGADISGRMIPTRYLIDSYRIDLAYYATDQDIARRDYAVQGLALPEAVLRKVFCENAVRWIPGIEKDFR